MRRVARGGFRGARFNPAHAHRGIVEEGERVRWHWIHPDAGEQQIWKATFCFLNLGPGFVANHAMKIPDHQRIGMGAVGGAENVVGASDVGHPITHCLIDRLLERLLTGVDGHHLGPEHFHPVHVQGLSFTVHGTHVDDALEANMAATVAVATPCCPAPVSAMTRVFPMRLAMRACPRALLILWAPVWAGLRV